LLCINIDRHNIKPIERNGGNLIIILTVHTNFPLLSVVMALGSSDSTLKQWYQALNTQL
jgi:hypothetical protein